MEGFGPRLIDLRKRHYGISQDELSRFLGVTRGTYAHWEMGLAEPSLKHLMMLADFHHCSLDFLYGREQDVPEDVVDTVDTRPLESLNKDSKEALKAVFDQLLAGDDGTQSRKMQRHLKNLEKEAEIEAQRQIEAEAMSDEPAKKKRGRPSRKDKLELLASAPKRRGRPRKNPLK